MLDVMAAKDCNIQKWFGNKWMCLLFNIVVFVLLAWLLPIHFEENDDVTMCLIASGNASGSPDGHLVFINAVYGWTIAGLYSLSKAVEWYTLAFALFHILSITGIVVIVLENKGWNWILKYLFLVFLYVFWIRIIIGFQFTTTAGLLSFSGCLALLKPSRKWRVVGVGAVFVASLIRFAAAGVVGLLFLPLFVAESFRDKHYITWVICVAMLAVIGRFVDNLCYSQSDWAQYRAYNHIRSSIQDSPYKDDIVELELPDGVSIDDYKLFRNFEGDPGVMTYPNIVEIGNRLKQKHTIQQSVNNLAQLQLYRIPLFFLFVGYGICLAMNAKRRKKGNAPSALRVIKVAMTIGLFVVLIIGLGATYQFKNRVFLCMLLPMVWQMIEAFPIGREDYTKLGLGLMIVAVVGVVEKYSFQDYKVIRSVRLGLKEFVEYQYPLVKSQKGVVYPGSLGLEWLNPFEIKELPFRLVGLGWSSGIPFQKGVLDSHRSFIDSGIIWFGKTGNSPVGIAKAIERNYGVKVRICTIEQNERYALFLME